MTFENMLGSIFVPRCITTGIGTKRNNPSEPNLQFIGHFTGSIREVKLVLWTFIIYSFNRSVPFRSISFEGSLASLSLRAFLFWFVSLLRSWQWRKVDGTTIRTDEAFLRFPARRQWFCMHATEPDRFEVR